MAYARWMLRQCERFGALPSQIEDEDAEFLRLLEIEGLVGGD